MVSKATDTLRQVAPKESRRVRFAHRFRPGGAHSAPYRVMFRSILGLIFGLVFLLSGIARADTDAYILLQDSPLAGFQFHEGKALWSQLKEGDVLTLAREPENHYDPKAVRVEWQGHKLGYVPRRENLDLARLLDNGQQLKARITRLQQARNPWERIRFEVLAPLH